MMSTSLPERGNHPSVIVCQHGARHRYAIPRMLQEAGMLGALYTDSSAYSRAGKIALKLSAIGISGASVRALASRVPEGIPVNKVVSSDRTLLASVAGKELFADLSSVFIQRGLGTSTIIYSMYGEDVGFLEWAKGQGAKIIVDVFVHPATYQIVNNESMNERGEPIHELALIGAVNDHLRSICTLADLVSCPSEWVHEGVVALLPEVSHKLCVLPYGSSIQIRDSISEGKEPGRILFAGRDPLRKGLHHLAAAVSRVKSAGGQVRLLAAGISENDVQWIRHRDEIECLGTLPMDRMAEELELADLFVLPSLSEGQAGVILEALACGCPVIATRESGVDLAADAGITVPVGDPESLAKAILEVVHDRALRRTLAEGALRQATTFSMDVWKQNLTNLIQQVVSTEFET